MNYKELIAALPSENTEYVDEAIEAAFSFLEKAGEGLTDRQKVAVLFLADVAHRHDSDTWDHEIRTDTDDPVKLEVARLLSGYKGAF